jgi:hypothetical protein
MELIKKVQKNKMLIKNCEINQTIILGFKICSKCDTFKELYYFNKDSSKSSGFTSSCRPCNEEQKRNYYKKNSISLNKKSVIYEKLNKESARLRKLKYSQSEKGKLKMKEWKLNNKKVYINPYKTEEQKSGRLESQKRYRLKNKDKIKENTKPRKITEEQRKKYRKKEYEKLKKDPYKLFIHYSRIRLNSLINRNNRMFSIKSAIEFSREELMQHLESRFKEGMNWENYGRNGWHIDHIKPIVLFNLEDDLSLKEAWNLKNLQPLWGTDNCSKGSLYKGVRYKSTKK